MFSGIVESIGKIRHARSAPGGRRLTIDVGAIAGDCALGASVCISGVCLTVAERDADTLTFDVIKETLDKTTLGAKQPGAGVNIERSLRVGDRVDGHFVQGHIDGTAIVKRVTATPAEHVLHLCPDAPVRRFIVPKGSVTVDGVSLTIADVDGDTFSVALIPTTLERTTLATLHQGDRVNIETDIITRTVVHHLTEQTSQGGVTLDALREARMA